MADERAYRIQVLFTPESESYKAVVPELELEIEAPSRGEAIEQIEAAIEARVQEVASTDDNLPRPVDAQPLEGGDLGLSLNGMLLRELSFQAQRAEVSVEELALQLIAQGVGQLEGHRPQRKPRGAPADRGPRPKGDNKPDEERQPNHHEERGRGRGGNRNNQQRNRNNPGNSSGNNTGNRGGGRREGYRPEMDNQADFLAYVRDMEKGGGGGRGRR